MNLTKLTAKLFLCKRRKHENIMPMTRLQKLSFIIIYASSKFSTWPKPNISVSLMALMAFPHYAYNHMTIK